MSAQTMRWIGGVKIGWIMASAPFATLIASSDCLVIKIIGLGTYRFYREQVASIEYNGKNLLNRSIKIIHSNLDAPVEIVFFCSEEPQRVVETIYQLGFMPRMNSLSVQSRQGIPVRWAALIVAISIWNLPFLVAQLHPSLSFLPVVALVVLPFGSYLLLANASLQKLVLKPERRVGEIRPFLKLCILIFCVLILASGIAIIISKYSVLILPFLFVGQFVLLFVIGYPALRWLRYKKRKA